jgi:RND superfamily putative drug exporter
MPDPQAPGNDAPTTRFSIAGAAGAAKNLAKNAVNQATAAASSATQRLNRPAPGEPAPEREIESWLGELRGNPAPKAPEGPQDTQAAPPTTALPPSAAPTRAIDSPAAGETTELRAQDQPAEDLAISAEETRAIPIARPDRGDTDAATEQLNARGKNEDAQKEGAQKEGEERQRRGTGGGVSAADLLRREGRL